ncbi:hypothetical protein AMS68_000680 [Peltaster fructicola]|uniref:DUF1765-domain-containing protein n=1 Tax=Peltaster fructicola TaxID=286661 RepID=A0A6H0XKA3_9PEZI|nr:hypothetical protein AMS68_000680 [Peltaster fructicola]
MVSALTETLTTQRSRPSLLTNVSPVHKQGTSSSNDHIPSPVSPLHPADFQRSASYTYLPTSVKEQYITRHNVFTTKGSFSEEDLVVVPEHSGEPFSEPSSGWTTPEEHDTGLYARRNSQQELALEICSSPKITVKQFLDLENAAIQAKRDESTSTASRARQRSSVSTNASQRLQRRSWYSVATTPDSRSPSPSKKDAEDGIDIPRANTARRRSALPRGESFVTIEEQDDRSVELEESRPSTSRRSSIFRGTRPLSSIFSRSPSSETVPIVPTIPKSFSTDRLTTFTTATLPEDRTAFSPRLGHMGNAQAVSGGSRKKDELWSVFRTLDADYNKFTSKSVALKANVIRNGLVPFLRKYADHPSTFILRSEDLDRRANILNKWWTGLIEMLHGRNNQSVSGTDRPVILDGIAGIMQRPEWRLYPSPFSPLDLRLRGTQNKSHTSLSSATSDHLQNSVQQNVQNIFVQNLRSQMAFVVDKMSLKNASASLVTFCGKACAYAFMFVPGMADVLVRLWDLDAETLRRVLKENGVERFVNISSTSDDILAQFPPCLHELKFTTLAEFNRKLRTPPPLPSGTTNIQWWGYWLERWTGHESDLFYVFVKYYHILVSEFLHTGSTKEERMCVPGMLLVHAQILKDLDATIHRKLGKNAVQDALALSQAMDAVLADPDAIASTLPLPPINATRQMAENRLIMLIRDFLSERAAAYPAARQLFAETFNGLLQAATTGISVYDPTACYTLLELLEEALVILVKYEQLSTGLGTLINPEFWHLVSRRMISSENILVEIRLYAFLYTVWNTVVCDETRKADLCMGLLLSPNVFYSRFNHWSPMVRAYYMRLLCWRVARFDGDASSGDFEILDTLLERLQTIWSHYLWLQDDVDGIAQLQAIPSNPAPNRRLRIVRTDTNINAGSFPSFDVINPPMPPPPQSRTKQNKHSTLSTLASVAELETRIHEEALERESVSPTGIRGLFRKGGSNGKSSQGSSSATQLSELGQAKDAALTHTQSATDDLSPSGDLSFKSGSSTPTAATDGKHRPFSFKFAIEYNVNIKEPKPLRLVPPRLPAPAQRFLAATSERVNSPLVMAVVEPRGAARRRVKYNGRALAEWALIVGECHSFFERRRNEGVPDNKTVETPSLSVDIIKRPG